jgi:hypothetical protein
MKHDPIKDNATGQGGVVDTAYPSPGNSSSHSLRERRLLAVLATCEETSRHDLDRMAGYENAPDGVMSLRRDHGFDLPMKKRPFIGRDNRKVYIGYYSLSDRGLERIVSANVALEVV